MPDNNRSEQFGYQVDGLLRLASARDTLDALVGGHWSTTPAVVGAVAHLLSSAQLRFLWAQLVAAA